ncbi:inactive serine protease PAMR1 [Narcine bancroftii]|uniref:inactive serine protease PAMR1 n=1 Tax=Narcine bancroftii TaxID=1343680 RepID=UPI0038317A26
MLSARGRMQQGGCESVKGAQALSILPAFCGLGRDKAALMERLELSQRMMSYISHMKVVGFFGWSLLFLNAVVGRDPRFCNMKSGSLGETCEGETVPCARRRGVRRRRPMESWTPLSLLLFLGPGFLGLTKGYTLINEDCPGAEWNIMCRECCETDQIECPCPGKQEVVGYSVPCCRNEENECDSCLIHPGCVIFDNCKRCNNGSWGTLDDFYIKGLYCSECHTGWSGGDCLKCGAVINASRGFIVLEGYPGNSHCEWTVTVNPNFAIELRFSMLSLEFDYMCQYDYVEVRDGDNIDSRVIGKFCGNERPAPVRSTRNLLHLLFVSDGYKSFDGFYATFEEVDACSSSPCLHDGMCLQLGPAGYECACLAGYTGKRCENMVICRNPVAPVNGTVKGDDFRFGSQVNFGCAAEFHLVGSSVATCQLDGNWSASAPHCVPESKLCADPGAPINGHRKFLTGGRYLRQAHSTLGTIVQFTCNVLFVLRGSPQARCQQDGTWSEMKPTCTQVPERKHCAISGAPLNGHQRILPGSGQLYQGYATLGTVVQFTCDYSFVLNGSPQARCQHDGTWSEKQPACKKERKHCAISGAPLNGHQRILPGSGQLYQGYATLGTVVQFTCDYSFVLNGSPQARCQHDGTWSEKQPACKKAAETKQCGDPGAPRNGHRRILSGSGHLHQGHATLGTVMQFTCDYSFVLSGRPQITCQQDGTWTGMQPRCIKACKKPKLPNLVKQKVLSTQPQSRSTPLHRLLSTILDKGQAQFSPTKAPVQRVGNLPAGFYHPHTQLEYECISPFYRRLGSRKRTCLKTGKWSGRSPTCIPICGKLGNFSQENVPSMSWPWQAALYRKASRTNNEIGSGRSWFLACSGAVLNERSVVMAAHCVTELGKAVLINTADLMVVLGKYLHDEAQQEESRQYLQISGVIVHPSYDPILLDSDIAVIKLMDKAKITDQVQPICLPDSSHLSAIGSRGYITGWRMQSEAGEPSHVNDTLRVGAIAIGDAVQCEQQYEEHGISVSITENMFCARRDPRGFSNICPLETGGVASLPAADKVGKALTWYLVGLVSWGYEKGCSHELFTVYTNVTPFKDWIEKHLK